MSLNLNPDIEARLTALAQASGLSVEDSCSMCRRKRRGKPRRCASIPNMGRTVRGVGR